jgi:oxaloacetate decarboxylase gamma subunit
LEEIVTGTLIDQGLELMLFGMGTVVVFLSLLVLVTSAMSALIERFAPLPPVVETAATATTEDPLLLAVITAAIKKHRSRP